MSRFMIETETDCEPGDISALLYLGNHSSERPEFFPSVNIEVVREVQETNVRGDGTPRMTTKQRDKLWRMCGDYNVPFREDDYGVLRNGWIESWVGGYRHDGQQMSGYATLKKTIFVGVSPEGDSHT